MSNEKIVTNTDSVKVLDVVVDSAQSLFAAPLAQMLDDCGPVLFGREELVDMEGRVVRMTVREEGGNLSAELALLPKEE